MANLVDSTVAIYGARLGFAHGIHASLIGFAIGIHSASSALDARPLVANLACGAIRSLRARRTEVSFANLSVATVAVALA